ncbi:MAG TPA: hypothetical protein DCP28_30950 [Cytophagales bacterium]|nr:hypothetical protein [Cytophagales bacterium]
MKRLPLITGIVILMGCEPSGDLQVTVVDASNANQPVVEAQVVIEGQQAGATNADGQIAFVEVVADQSLQIQVTHPQFLDGSELVFVPRNTIYPAQVELTRRGILEISVVNSRTGDPLDDIIPTVFFGNEESSGIALGGAIFQYSIIQPGTYTISSAETEDYEEYRTSVRVEHGSPTYLLMNLTPKASLTVAVNDASSSQPLENAQVIVTSVDGVSQPKQTNGVGSVLFEGLSGGVVLLEVSRDGYDGRLVSFYVPPGDPSVVTVELIVLGGIRGLVRDTETELPIAGATITLMSTLDQRLSDGDGRFMYEALEAGNYTLQTEASGYRTGSISALVANGIVATPVLELEPLQAVPRLNVSDLDFGSNETQGTITLFNDQPGTSLMFEVIENVAWLSTNPTNGEVTQGNPVSIVFTLDRSLLNNGDYERSITISTNNGDLVLPIRVTQSSDLCTTTTDLRYGTEKTQLDIPLRNCGSGSISYTVSTNEDWISLGLQSGSVGNETDAISVSVSRATLSAGNYEGTVYINSAAAGAIEVPVYMTVENLGGPQLSLSLEQIDFGVSGQTQSLTLSNTGSETLNWSSGSTSTWLTLGPDTGSLESGDVSTLLFSADRTGLAAGMYEDRVQFSGVGAEPLYLDIDMTVASAAILGASPSTLDFGTEGTQRSLSVSNLGVGEFSWNATALNSWIKVYPQQGTTAEMLTVNIDRSSLDYGEFSGSLQLDAGDAGIISVAITGSQPAPPPALSFSGFSLESDEDGSGKANPGETVSYSFTLSSPSDAATNVQNLTIDLSSEATLDPVRLAIDQLAPGETSANQSLSISFDKELEGEEVIQISLTLSDADGNTWSFIDSVQVVARYVVSEGLVAYFPFDEGNLNDATGNYSGINDGGISFTTDRPNATGFAVEFVATEEDFFSVGSNPFYTAWEVREEQSGTISFWIKANALAVDQMLFFGSRSETDHRFQVQVDSGYAMHINTSASYTNYGNWYWYHDPIQLSAAADVTFMDGKWHHVVLTIEEDAQNLYVDGYVIASNSVDDGLSGIFENEGFTVGRRPEVNDMYFNGKLDNLRFYRRILTREEVRKIFNAVE